MWTRYTERQLVELASRADRAALVHFERGAPYMASLCEGRAAELRAELTKRQAVERDRGSRPAEMGEHDNV